MDQKNKASKEEELKKKVYEAAIDTAILIAKKGEGGLIVIGKTKDYECHFPNFFENKKFYITDNGMTEVLSKLGIVDGAIVLDPDGRIKAYGARILKQETAKGFGTRHSAAKGISNSGCLAILASEQDKVVRIFKEGNKVMEINPHTKTVEKNVSKIVKILTKTETAGLIAGAAAVPIIGIPGVIVFGGSYFVSKTLLGMIREIDFK
ncbi:DNA integrity scanning protein DisA nucleotide-binding domain protein [Candidatus Micrarchaeota archaeon]|nr:DNA integrity scanning protein DisA nucleotide-binding domain protein [Candidatus Micrarchaeota archaeon]